MNDREFTNINVKESILLDGVPIVPVDPSNVPGHTISQHTDVSGTATNGQFFIWNAATSKWEPSFRIAPNNTWITARNAANSADVNLLRLNASDLIEIGAHIAMAPNQTERFIRVYGYGGAIRFRGDSSSATDRGVWLGMIDNNGTWWPVLGAIEGVARAFGDLYVANNCSALSFTDRTPYPESTLQAYRAVNSMTLKVDSKGQPLGVDHAKLDPFIRADNKDKEVVGRDLSATVSALVAVVQDLTRRVVALESQNKTAITPQEIV
jgi:hypothetical protein